MSLAAVGGCAFINQNSGKQTWKQSSYDCTLPCVRRNLILTRECQSATMTLAFVPGFPSSGPRFLGRFLPPVADGVAAAYANSFSQVGDVILDPFGQSPGVAAEALSLDRRVIVACSNPILRLALSLAVHPPALADL